jgi:hypothetical protein
MYLKQQSRVSKTLKKTTPSSSNNIGSADGSSNSSSSSRIIVLILVLILVLVLFRHGVSTQLAFLFLFTCGFRIH